MISSMATLAQSIVENCFKRSKSICISVCVIEKCVKFIHSSPKITHISQAKDV